MDYSLPGSSVHGIFQARILEWVAIPFSISKSLIQFSVDACVPSLLFGLRPDYGRGYKKIGRLCYFGLQNHCRRWLQPWNKKTLTPSKKSYDQSRQHIKKQRHYFSNKGPSSQGYGFSSSYVWMWELDYKKSWVPKNWCFWPVVLEKTLESPLDGKEIQPVHPKGNQSWMFIGRTDAEAETPILWPPDELTHLKRLWCWERLKARGGGDDRGWDGWMASWTRRTWVWVNSGSWWWTGRPGMLQSTGLQRVRHNWVTELNWLNEDNEDLLQKDLCTTVVFSAPDPAAD